MMYRHTSARLTSTIPHHIDISTSLLPQFPFNPPFNPSTSAHRRRILRQSKRLFGNQSEDHASKAAGTGEATNGAPKPSYFYTMRSSKSPQPSPPREPHQLTQQPPQPAQQSVEPTPVSKHPQFPPQNPTPQPPPQPKPFQPPKPDPAPTLQPQQTQSNPQIPPSTNPLNPPQIPPIPPSSTLPPPIKLPQRPLATTMKEETPAQAPKATPNPLYSTSKPSFMNSIRTIHAILYQRVINVINPNRAMRARPRAVQTVLEKIGLQPDPVQTYLNTHLHIQNQAKLWADLFYKCRMLIVPSFKHTRAAPTPFSNPQDSTNLFGQVPTFYPQPPLTYRFHLSLQPWRTDFFGMVSSHMHRKARRKLHQIYTPAKPPTLFQRLCRLRPFSYTIISPQSFVFRPSTNHIIKPSQPAFQLVLTSPGKFAVNPSSTTGPAQAKLTPYKIIHYPWGRLFRNSALFTLSTFSALYLFNVNNFRDKFTRSELSKTYFKFVSWWYYRHQSSHLTRLRDSAKQNSVTSLYLNPSNNLRVYNFEEKVLLEAPLDDLYLWILISSAHTYELIGSIQQLLNDANSSIEGSQEIIEERIMDHLNNLEAIQKRLGKSQKPDHFGLHSMQEFGQKVSNELENNDNEDTIIKQVLDQAQQDKGVGIGIGKNKDDDEKDEKDETSSTLSTFSLFPDTISNSLQTFLQHPTIKPYAGYLQLEQKCIENVLEKFPFTGQARHRTEVNYTQFFSTNQLLKNYVQFFEATQFNQHELKQLEVTLELFRHTLVQLQSHTSNHSSLRRNSYFPPSITNPTIITQSILPFSPPSIKTVSKWADDSITALNTLSDKYLGTQFIQNRRILQAQIELDQVTQKLAPEQQLLLEYDRVQLLMHYSMMVELYHRCDEFFTALRKKRANLEGFYASDNINAVLAGIKEQTTNALHHHVPVSGPQLPTTTTTTTSSPSQHNFNDTFNLNLNSNKHNQLPDIASTIPALSALTTPSQIARDSSTAFNKLTFESILFSPSSQSISPLLRDKLSTYVEYHSPPSILGQTLRTFGDSSRLYPEFKPFQFDELLATTFQADFEARLAKLHPSILSLYHRFYLPAFSIQAITKSVDETGDTTETIEVGDSRHIDRQQLTRKQLLNHVVGVGIKPQLFNFVPITTEFVRTIEHESFTMPHPEKWAENIETIQLPKLLKSPHIFSVSVTGSTIDVQPLSTFTQLETEHRQPPTPKQQAAPLFHQLSPATFLRCYQDHDQSHFGR